VTALRQELAAALDEEGLIACRCRAAAAGG